MWPVLTEKAVQGAILTESYGNFGLSAGHDRPSPSSWQMSPAQLDKLYHQIIQQLEQLHQPKEHS